MLRHLGATYYQTLYGRATAADVAKAVESVTAQEESTAQPAGGRRKPAAGRATQAGAGSLRTGRWRVRDVMMTEVVIAHKDDTYKRIASLIGEHRVGRYRCWAGTGTWSASCPRPT